MGDNLKDTIKKSLDIDVKSIYDGDFDSNVVEITQQYLNKKQKKDKQEVILAALIEYLKSVSSSPLTDIKFIKSVLTIDPSLTNFIIEYFMNDTFSVRNIGIKYLINDIVGRTKNLDLLEYIVDKSQKIDPLELSINISKLINRLNFYEKNERVLEILEMLLHQLSTEEIVKYILRLDVGNPRIKKTISEILKSVLDSYSLTMQSDLFNKLTIDKRDQVKPIFNKLVDKDYKIVGTFHHRYNSVAMIRDLKTKLYGYVDKEGKIIIPPKFDEMSSVNNDGVITGKVIKKVDSLEPGYYKIDTSGKVLEYFT